MREIERRCALVGLPSQVLMENAGLAVAKEVRRLLGSTEGRRILVLIGPGNNGGDGLVAARHLHDWGAKVSLYHLSQRDESDPNYRSVLERDIASFQATVDEGLVALEGLISSSEVIIDAIFGTGKARPIGGVFKQVLERVKVAKAARPKLTIVALDLPSGLNPDNGEVDPSCLSADFTITLGYPKLGLFTLPGGEKAGETIIVDIGIPPSLGEDLPTELITADWVRSILPRRPLSAHKGTFGRVLIAAGSINYIGAAYLACSGAIRVGAGLVTLATARSLQPILAAKLTEVTYAPLPEFEPGIIHQEASKLLRDLLPDYDVLLLGCGVGQSPSAMEFIRDSILLLPAGPSLVIDADALNTLAKTPRWWERLAPEAVLTPHPGEMSRLVGMSVDDIQCDRLGVAREAAVRWQKTVALKGAYTVVAAPDGRARISPVANPGLASAGTGDVLAGAIAGLMAQGLEPFDAAACGVYLHGEAGRIVRAELGDTGMIASDLLPALPLAIKRIKEGYREMLYAFGH